MQAAFHVMTGLLVLVTLLPLSRHQAWWVRGWDFPRLQLAVGAGALLAVELSLPPRGSALAWLPVALTSACVIYQGWWIVPYTPFFRREVKSAGPSATDRLRILSTNVLMTNRRSADLIALVQDEAPDLLITLETNRRWEQELKPLEAAYPHVLRCPLENLYGMHVYSRLPLEDSKTQFLVEHDAPSMHTQVVLPSGQRVRLHSLHPAPPSPTENETSEERDAELIMVARSVAQTTQPVIVSGDLNDVAWSDTTRLFRKLSGLLDPRVGRGMYNTFHTHFPFFRWPVDHFFHSKEFTLVRLTRLRSIGSDHFPVLIELALESSKSHAQEGLKPEADDHLKAREKEKRKAVTAETVHTPGERRDRHG